MLDDLYRKGTATPFRTSYLGFLRAYIFQQAGKFVRQTVLCKFFVYLPSRMRDSCTSVASVLRGMPATPAHGTRKLRIRCGQHTCTARYGRVNSVVNARELCARCEETWIYKNERFYPISGNHLSVLINQNDFQILQKTLLISEIIYRYWKLLSDIGNYFPNREILDKCPLTSLTPFTDIV